MLHGILDDDHLQWHPPLIRHYTNFWPYYWSRPNLTFYLIARSFHRTFATGAVCQQRTLTSPDTWFCPILGLASVLCWDQSLLNLSCFRTFEFRTSLGSSVFACNDRRVIRALNTRDEIRETAPGYKRSSRPCDIWPHQFHYNFT